jgi:non-ribosomal peptide synthetase component F
LEQSNPRTPYDLVVNFSADNENLRGSACYNQDIFEQPSIEHLMRRFVRLLKDMTVRPDTRIASLQMLSEEKIAQVARESTIQELATDLVW